MAELITLPSLAYPHLLLRLRPLNRLLANAVRRQQRAARRYSSPNLESMCVTDKQVAVLLDNVDRRCSGRGIDSADRNATAEETTLEAALRRRAADNDCSLPLDTLEAELSLDPFEILAVLACAAPEIESSYRRIYAYVLDDARRQGACNELLVELLATSEGHRAGLIVSFGPNGNLRRSGILQAGDASNNQFGSELKVSTVALERLLGSGVGWRHDFVDPENVITDRAAEKIGAADEAIAMKVGRALRQKSIDVAGIWGQRGTNVEAVVRAAAAYTGLRLQLAQAPIAADGSGVDLRAIRSSLARASATGSILWLRTDPLRELEYSQWGELVAQILGRTDVPLFMSGEYPWRPTEVIAHRNYLEFSLRSLTHEERAATWRRQMPEVSSSTADTLATRYRFNVDEVAAAARTARVRSRIEGNGTAVPANRFLDASCAIVARRRSSKFASLVEPERTMSDLILPPQLHRQVAEVSRFYKNLHKVDEEWGFGRLVTGGGGTKVLLAGESGCGKTLAVEAIAHDIGIPMMKCDAAQLVSKWVGETEKNLEAVFREAEESHVVLFFDEADSLFGKRGDVSTGSDRWANLEVGFLLQRLEAYWGLVVLASNMTDSIDSAFSRRFQIVINFPRPGADERRQIWRHALPAAAPVDDHLDFDALTDWDMTGAAIVNAARSAALYAADRGASSIGMEHVVFAITRQYQREARIIAPSQLGHYAEFASAEP